MSDSATPWTVACQAPLSMGFSKQEYWDGFPFPSPGDLPNPGIEPVSLTSPALALAGRFFTTSTTWEAPPGKPQYCCGVHVSFQISIFFFLFQIYTQRLSCWIIWYLFLVFWGTSILFSIVAIPAHIPTNSVQEFPLLHILPNNLLFVDFLLIAIPTGVRWILIVVVQ